MSNILVISAKIQLYPDDFSRRTPKSDRLLAACRAFVLILLNFEKLRLIFQRTNCLWHYVDFTIAIVIVIKKIEVSWSVRFSREKIGVFSKGKEKYKLRKQTVEPVFGIIKEILGFKHFHLRGLKKARLEWDLVTTAYNFKRLFKMINGSAVSENRVSGAING